MCLFVPPATNSARTRDRLSALLVSICLSTRWLWNEFVGRQSSLTSERLQDAHEKREPYIWRMRDVLCLVNKTPTWRLQESHS